MRLEAAVQPDVLAQSAALAQPNPWALSGVALVGALTFYLGHRSSRLANSTHDFLVARRAVRSRRNAAAIAGEYLSAASFLGVAGILFKDGADALWYPIGFTAGYLALMLFVAAPLRRSGAYTLPDFLEMRLGSVGLRRLASTFVVFIGVLYLVPQLQGAGLALQVIMPTPVWVGAVAVTVIVAVNVIAGGMRAITVVQAFQYWLKLFAVAVPAFVLCAVFVTGGGKPMSTALDHAAPPTFTEPTTVRIDTPVTLTVSAPVLVRTDGAEQLWLPGEQHRVATDTKLGFPAAAAVPVIAGSPVNNHDWLTPNTNSPRELISTYSLIIATFLGTMGLPHVLVRFYTNPDGRAARRTTVHVLLLLGLFYLFPTLLGALARLYVPKLLVTGGTDAAVLLLPSAMLPPLAGQIVGAIFAAGAFAAFLSTSSGLLVSIAGVLSTDVFRGRVRDFRVASGLVAILPMVLAIVLRPSDLSLSVGLSFALAASTFSPLLVLGIWWRGLTWQGATAGLCVGGGLMLAAIGLNIAGGDTAPWITQQPAIITVPAAFLATVLVSKASSKADPDEIGKVMLRLHAPDPLGFMRDRAVARFGQAEEKVRLEPGRHRKNEPRKP